MTKRNWLAVTINALFLAGIGFFLSAVQLFAFLYFRSVWLMFLTDGQFLITEILSGVILKKKFSKIEVKMIQLFGTVLYVILVIGGFPFLLNLGVYSMYIPETDLSYSFILSFERVGCYIASFIATVFNLGILHDLRREERKTLENRT